MNGWINWIVQWIDGWIDWWGLCGLINGKCKDGIHERMDRWMNRWTGGWMNGLIDESAAVPELETGCWRSVGSVQPSNWWGMIGCSHVLVGCLSIGPDAAASRKFAACQHLFRSKHVPMYAGSWLITIQYALPVPKLLWKCQLCSSLKQPSRARAFTKVD